MKTCFQQAAELDAPVTVGTDFREETVKGLQLLILDLDETLIHATKEFLGRKPCFEVENYFVYKRPHVDQFLDYVLARYTVAIWTSSGDVYAQQVIENLFPDVSVLKFVWCRERCITRIDANHYYYTFIKDLKKVKRLGYDLDRVLMIDDSPEKHSRSYGNLLPVLPYYGNQDDRELEDLIRYLPMLDHVENIRTVEKRKWRNNANRPL